MGFGAGDPSGGRSGRASAPEPADHVVIGTATGPGTGVFGTGTAPADPRGTYAGSLIGASLFAARRTGVISRAGTPTALSHGSGSPPTGGAPSATRRPTRPPRRRTAISGVSRPVAGGAGTVSTTTHTSAKEGFAVLVDVIRRRPGICA